MTKTWITDTLPDSEITVLMRRQDEEFPVWPGYHDGEVWMDSDGFTVNEPVLGWMHLEDAALIIDGGQR
jgi:hypothetical protein